MTTIIIIIIKPTPSATIDESKVPEAKSESPNPASPPLPTCLQCAHRPPREIRGFVTTDSVTGSQKLAITPPRCGHLPHLASTTSQILQNICPDNGETCHRRNCSSNFPLSTVYIYLSNISLLTLLFTATVAELTLHHSRLQSSLLSRNNKNM